MPIGNSRNMSLRARLRARQSDAKRHHEFPTGRGDLIHITFEIATPATPRNDIGGVKQPKLRGYLKKLTTLAERFGKL